MLTGFGGLSSELTPGNLTQGCHTEAQGQAGEEVKLRGKACEWRERMAWGSSGGTGEPRWASGLMAGGQLGVDEETSLGTYVLDSLRGGEAGVWPSLP